MAEAEEADERVEPITLAEYNATDGHLRGSLTHKAWQFQKAATKLVHAALQPSPSEATRVWLQKKKNEILCSKGHTWTAVIVRMTIPARYGSNIEESSGEACAFLRSPWAWLRDGGQEVLDRDGRSPLMLLSSAVRIPCECYIAIPSCQTDLASRRGRMTRLLLDMGHSVLIRDAQGRSVLDYFPLTADDNLHVGSLLVRDFFFRLASVAGRSLRSQPVPQTVWAALCRDRKSRAHSLCFLLEVCRVGSLWQYPDDEKWIEALRRGEARAARGSHIVSQFQPLPPALFAYFRAQPDAEPIAGALWRLECHERDRLYAIDRLFVLSLSRSLQQHARARLECLFALSLSQSLQRHAHTV